MDRAAGPGRRDPRRVAGAALFAVLMCVPGAFGCSSREASGPAHLGPAAPVDPPPPQSPKPKAETATATIDSTCKTAGALPPERVALSSNTATTITSGLEVHFVGESIDHYEDGSFDNLAEVRFVWGSREASQIVSVLPQPQGPPLRPILGHCWRLVGTADGTATVEIALADNPELTRLPSCAAHPSSAPLFDSYYAAKTDTPFHALIAYDDNLHDWRFSPTPTILRHHATRTDWADLAKWGRAGLGAARGDTVRIEFSFISSDVRVRGERRWTSQHVAKIEAACLL